MSEYNSRFFRHMTRMRAWQYPVGANIIKCFKFKSLIDFGCGCGYYLEGAIDSGASIKGLEYSFENAKPYIPRQVLPYCEAADLTQPVFYSGYDCAICFEMAEHLRQEAADTLIDSLVLASNFICFSSSDDKDAGYEHINSQPIQYWIDKFDKRNYFYSETDTRRLRSLFWQIPFHNRAVMGMYKSVVAFRRK